MLTVIGFLALPRIAGAQNTIVIDVTKIQSQKGAIYIQVHNASQNFPKGKPSFQTMLKCNGKDRISASFIGVENGLYAISAFQDINGNGKFDKNFIGIPKEPYALSNNFHPKMSAPSFEDCKVTVNAAKTSFELQLIN